MTKEYVFGKIDYKKFSFEYQKNLKIYFFFISAILPSEKKKEVILRLKYFPRI
ncbi:hypothetical protein Hanom_Chr11g01012871 [Helianthus anomalus]